LYMAVIIVYNRNGREVQHFVAIFFVLKVLCGFFALLQSFAVPCGPLWYLVIPL